MKVKKQINLECNTLPLIDEDLGKEQLRMQQQLEAANKALQEDLRVILCKTEMKCEESISSMNGSHPDEVSLLTHISAQFFQCIPEMVYTE